MVFETFLLITAIVFTVFGYSLGRKRANYNLVEQSVAATIDNLVKGGYLKTVGHGDDMIILKHDDKTTRT